MDIYIIIQTPLQGLTDSFGGVLVISFLMPFVWWFGVHNMIIGGVVGPILLSNTIDNQAMIDSGKALTIQNGAHIVTNNL